MSDPLQNRQAPPVHTEKLSLPKEDKNCKISFLHQRSVRETYHIHSHDFYEIFYVVKGRALHNINGLSECLLSGTVELIRPSDCHEYSFINRYDMELVSIGIEPSLMEEILEFTELSPAVIHTEELPLQVMYAAGQADSITASLMKIGGISDSRKKRTYAKAVISQILLDMTENRPSPAKIPYWLDTLIAQMAEPANFTAGLPRMLKLSPVTQNHLNRNMKKYLGMTPTEFINSKRIAHASGLLLKNRYSITEICGMCGFETASNFYENFRRVYDCSPKEFVKRQKNQYTGEIR